MEYYTVGHKIHVMGSQNVTIGWWNGFDSNDNLEYFLITDLQLIIF